MNRSDCGAGPRCAEVLDRLEAFLDGELEVPDVEELESHLAECGPCADRASFEERIRAIVARDCVEHAPAALIERIRLRLVDRPAR